MKAKKNPLVLMTIVATPAGGMTMEELLARLELERRSRRLDRAQERLEKWGATFGPSSAYTAAALRDRDARLVEVHAMGTRVAELAARRGV